MARFASTTAAELLAIKENVNARNTRKANERACSLLKSYLKEKEMPSSFWLFSKKELNEVLVQLYVNVRQVNGQKYKVSSFENIRHGLNRYLRSPPHEKDFDIIQDNEFREANVSYHAALKDLKTEGKGAVDHHPVISDSDLEKIRESIYLKTNTPYGLFNKVQFDIRFFFFRRGSENMHKMTRDTFVVKIDGDTGRRYIAKADEFTKNHREGDKENLSGFMPEMPDSDYCPVKSFLKYISKLNTKCNRMWQRPKDTFTDGDEIWYINSPVGEKTLSKFMTKLTTLCNLSQSYTNHCIRATGATLLSRANFSPAQIMSVTGHKSISSLAVYQRVSNTEKLQMAKNFGKSHDATKRERPYTVTFLVWNWKTEISICKN